MVPGYPHTPSNCIPRGNSGRTWIPFVFPVDSSPAFRSAAHPSCDCGPPKQTQTKRIEKLSVPTTTTTTTTNRSTITITINSDMWTFSYPHDPSMLSPGRVGTIIRTNYSRINPSLKVPANRCIETNTVGPSFSETPKRIDWPHRPLFTYLGPGRQAGR